MFPKIFLSEVNKITVGFSWYKFPSKIILQSQNIFISLTVFNTALLFSCKGKNLILEIFIGISNKKNRQLFPFSFCAPFRIILSLFSFWSSLWNILINLILP